MSPEVLADDLGRNSPLWTDGWRAFSAMDLDVVLRKMEQETPANIVFLDACRNAGVVEEGQPPSMRSREPAPSDRRVQRHAIDRAGEKERPKGA